MAEPPESDGSEPRAPGGHTLVPAPRRRVVVTRVSPGELSDPERWDVHEAGSPDDVVDELALDEAADRASEREAVQPLDPELVAQLQQFLPSLDETAPGEPPRPAEPEAVVYVPIDERQAGPRWGLIAGGIVAIVVVGLALGAGLALFTGGS